MKVQLVADVTKIFQVGLIFKQLVLACFSGLWLGLLASCVTKRQ